MIDGLSPYPEYRPSGVEWLGDVPSHWEIVTLRRHLRPFDGIKIGPFGSQLKLQEMVPVGYKVYGQANVIAKNFSIGSKFIDKQKFDELATCEIHHTDVVVSMMGTGGRCAVVPETASIGIMDSHLLRVRPDTEINPFYLALLIDRSAYVREQIDIAGKGAIMQGLNSSIIKNLVLELPPVSEQVAIVRFLDHADARIRRAIGARRRLVALLNEEKQAIIHRAVTRGLDPDVPLRPSGVEWLGDVPANWDISRVKSEFSCLNARRVPLNSVDRGEMKLRLYDYYGASGIIDKVDDYLFDDELLLIAEDGANLVLRNLPLAIIARGKFWVNNHAHILKPLRGNIEFLANLMENLNYLPWISGAAQPKLTQERLMNIAIAVPLPEEQNLIMQRISAETVPLKVTISVAYREVDLLLEFRTRLIADVVTGKLDVRGVAAGLPETAPGQATLDAFDAPAGDEEDAWPEPGAAFEDADRIGA